MKNFYTLLFSFLISFAASSQVVTNYNSKWFLGFNTGATWSCTDVDDSWMWRNNKSYHDGYNDDLHKNESNWGWGITLGKSFNYDYGNLFSFDLRGRYLRGRWYGQNSTMDSISMENYDPSINIEDASAEQLAQMYQAAYGGYIHNYEADIHRLGLELVLHFNRFRERTRIDPYIFGGIGLTFKRSMGDFLDDYGNLYDESTLLSHDLDLNYETQLNPNENLVHFMPSAGFGIGYQIAPRVSLGLEHKTTFTLKDQFDGVVSESPRLRNDWYHYTSGYIRFRLGGGNGSSGSSNHSSSDYSSNSNSNGSDVSNCPTPDVSIFNTQNQTVSNRTIQISARITNVSNVNEIKLMDANRMLLPFEFDSYSNKLSAVVNLNSGSNTFYVKANNNCGSDMEQLNIIYADCIPPDGYFISPSQNEVNVELANYQLKAHFNNLKSASMIKLFVNNIQVYGFSFDVTTGTFESDLTLFYGNNNIQIDFENPCGNGSIETSLNFLDCENPTIELLNPTASGSTTNNRIYEIRALISGSDEKGIETKLNGKLINKSDKQNWNLDINPVDHSILTFTVTLNNGINTIYIEATNDCGTETLAFTIDLEDCVAPEINIMSPMTGTTVQNSIVNLAAQIQNVSSAQNISYQFNGQALQGISYNSSNQTSSGTITLSPGDNYITVSASNDCGSDVETIHIIFDECKIPNINVLSSNIEVANDNYTFQASVENMPTQNGITLNLNGQNINYSFNNGLITTHVTLQPGENNFTLTAVRPCGRDTENLSVVYNNCTTPTVSFDSPSASKVVSTESQYLLVASTSNIVNPNQISITHNGNEVPFAFSNNKIKLIVMLNDGVNIVKIEVDNPCGEDEENVTINYKPCLVPDVIFNGHMSAIVSSSNFNSSVSTIPVSCTIQNYTPSTNIVVTNNGNIVPSHLYQIYNGTLNGSINLYNGVNTITFTAVSPCGSDSENIVVSYQEEISNPNTPNPGVEEEEEENGTDPGSSSEDESNDEGDSNEGDNGNNGNGNGNGNGNNGNDNNGHGNNDDGVDVSNPGQGNGGPNGEEDESGDVDDEGNGTDPNGNSSTPGTGDAGIENDNGGNDENTGEEIHGNESGGQTGNNSGNTNGNPSSGGQVGGNWSSQGSNNQGNSGSGGGFGSGNGNGNTNTGGSTGSGSGNSGNQGNEEENGGGNGDQDNQGNDQGGNEGTGGQDNQGNDQGGNEGTGGQDNQSNDQGGNDGAGGQDNQGNEDNGNQNDNGGGNNGGKINSEGNNTPKPGSNSESNKPNNINNSKPTTGSGGNNQENEIIEQQRKAAEAAQKAEQQRKAAEAAQKAEQQRKAAEAVKKASSNNKPKSSSGGTIQNKSNKKNTPSTPKSEGGKPKSPSLNKNGKGKGR